MPADLIVDFDAHNTPSPAHLHRPNIPANMANGRAVNGRPLSPSMGRPGRPFYADTPLAKLMIERNFRAVDVTTGSGVNPRSLSDYLAGRSCITPANIERLAAFFQLPEQVFYEMNVQLAKHATVQPRHSRKAG